MTKIEKVTHIFCIYTFHIFVIYLYILVVTYTCYVNGEILKSWIIKISMTNCNARGPH